METSLLILLITGILVGAASGYIGSFMVLKRMSLVGDALSHVALPGMAIAIVFGINPVYGALFSLVLAVVGIWYLGEHSEVYPEALVGVFFTASLAIGILITPQTELLEALFGNLESISTLDALVTMAISVLIFITTLKLSSKLLLGVVSEELASCAGVKISKVNLIYLLLVGLVVALGVKFVGTLLMGALVIVPAAAAKNIANSIRSFQAASIILGILSVVLGVVIAKVLGITSGPAIVLVSVAFFIFSNFFKSS